MASLQARHLRTCALGRPWTPFEVPNGCSCEPTYYVVVRDGVKLNRERVGKNRRQAERALRKIGSSIDEGAYTAQLRIAFREWGAQWLDSLERKPTTRASYASTIRYATLAFGEMDVRRIRAEHVGAFLRTLRTGVPEENRRGVSDSTRSKHLRVLNACFEAAVAHGYAGANPVRQLPKAQKPRPQRRESAYFEDDELPSLIAQTTAGVFRTLFLTALKTGMRQGELAALAWTDVDLGASVIRVRRSITDGHLGVPKNQERRDVDITADLVETLGVWWGESGRPYENILVFPGDGKHGSLIPTTILKRELYPAMKRAGIEREGATGELRTFHSFRHTYARIAMEHGAELTWLQRQLGHSSLAVTAGVYGHWERSARKRHTERMEGAFSV